MTQSSEGVRLIEAFPALVLMHNMLEGHASIKPKLPMWSVCPPLSVCQEEGPAGAKQGQENGQQEAATDVQPRPPPALPPH